MTSVNCLNGLSPTSQALIFASYNYQSPKVGTRPNAWREASRCMWTEPTNVTRARGSVQALSHPLPRSN